MKPCCSTVSALLLAAVTTACSGDAPSPFRDPDAAVLALEPLACGGARLAAGMHSRSVEHDGMQRFFDVYVPALAASGAAAPVVFYFHPLFTDRFYLQRVGTRELADAEGFIAVYPQGVDSSWNAGACCAPSNGVSGQPLVDDVGLVRRVLAAVEAENCVDPRRVYATGFSNGGFLSHRLACEASDRFAAIAAVAAVNGMSAEQCSPGRAVPVLQINGESDSLVKADGGFAQNGGTAGPFVSIRTSVEEWAVRNGAALDSEQSFEHGSARCQTYPGDAESVLCTVDAGHCWYNEPFCVIGPNSADIDATQATWQFLRRAVLLP